MSKSQAEYSVLVVDDSEFFATMTADVLRKEHGFRTDPAYGPREALETLKENSYDCIVSDFDMPEMNGLELFQQIQNHIDIPFILLTGRGDEETASEAIGAGVSDYLRKLEVVENQRYALLANRVRNAIRQHETQQKYELLVNNTPDAISQVAVDGTLLAANPALAHSFDSTAEDLVGMTITQLLPRDVATQRLNAGREAVRTGETVTLEDSCGGHHFHNILVPVTGEGKHKTFQLISRDITDEKEREDDVRRMNAELEVVNRIVRHDIRNDMNVITGWGEMLRDHVSDPGTRYLDRVLDASQHVIELTEITRDFVETITGRSDAELKDVRLDDVLRNEVDKKRTTYPDAEITVESCPRTTVRANEMLNSVFRNLLNNAVQHNDQETPRITITSQENDQQVSVTVTDNGPGVPDDQKEEIFGKGQKGLESEGTGIGLYLAYTLTQQYGGDIRVEDHDPRGAAFTVTLKKSGAQT